MSNKDGLEDAFGQLSIDRHANGRHDPNPLTFSDLTDSAILKVVNKCKLRDQWTLRKVSKRLRTLVDSARHRYNDLKFSCRRDHILYELGSAKVVYAGVDWNSKVVFSNMTYLSKYQPDKKIAISVEKKCKLLKSEDYYKMAFDDLAIALKNAKIEVESLTFEYCADNPNMPRAIQNVESSKRFYEKMRNLLCSLDHKLFVRRLKLVVKDPDDVLAILPYVVPVFLQEIAINSEVASKSWLDQEGIDKIVNLEQWMKAIDLLKTKNIFEFFPMEHLMHFERFRIYQSFVDTEFLLKLRELFSKMENFDNCYIESRDQFDSEFLAKHVGKPASPTQWSSNVCRYQIPDSIRVLEFQFHGIPYNSISITKLTLIARRSHSHRS